MFERLYTRPVIIAQHYTSPLSVERIAYLRSLEAQGMGISSLCDTAAYLLVIVRRLNLVNRPGEAISTEEIEREAVRWAARAEGTSNHRAGESSRHNFRLQATKWLRFLGSVPAKPRPLKPLARYVADFATYMESERGWSPVTIRCSSIVLHRCLGQLTADEESLATITIGKIDQLVQGLVSHGNCARSSVQRYATTLRAFFRYAEARGWCQLGLADAIQSPRVYSQSLLPAGPSWPEVQQLIANTVGDRRCDIRARAVIMLVAVYGLRAGDVTSLRLEDIDWERETFIVRSPKTRKDRTYPLIQPVGDAILRYLREARPRSPHRELLLTLSTPIRPVRTVWPIVANRLLPMGLSIPRHGPHALRHACATHLLAQGFSLKEIGDHLGHKNLDSTRVYAKVDLAGLRQVADFDLGGLL